MEHPIKRLWLAVASVMLIAGCAGDPAIKPWWTLREADLRQFKPGQTSKQEVRNLLGKPLVEMKFERLGEEVWDYRYLESSTVQMYATVHFDTRGLFKYYFAQPDPSRYDVFD